MIRSTERVLIPERGATLGNSGAANVTLNESWVTVSKGIWNEDALDRGAKGDTFIARILWTAPNKRQHAAPGFLLHLSRLFDKV